MSKAKLNGSVDQLVKAMRQVFSEAVQEATEPVTAAVADLKQDVNGLKQDVGGLDKKIDDGLRTTNENVQAQLAQHRQNIADDFKKALKAR